MSSSVTPKRTGSGICRCLGSQEASQMLDMCLIITSECLCIVMEFSQIPIYSSLTDTYSVSNSVFEIIKSTVFIWYLLCNKSCAKGLIDELSLQFFKVNISQPHIVSEDWNLEKLISSTCYRMLRRAVIVFYSGLKLKSFPSFTWETTIKCSIDLFCCCLFLLLFFKIYLSE